MQGALSKSAPSDRHVAFGTRLYMSRFVEYGARSTSLALLSSRSEMRFSEFRTFKLTRRPGLTWQNHWKAAVTRHVHVMSRDDVDVSCVAPGIGRIQGLPL